MARKHDKRRVASMSEPAMAVVTPADGDELISERDATQVAALSWKRWKELREQGCAPAPAGVDQRGRLVWSRNQVWSWRDAGYPRP
jgi:hypothetical protein